MPKVKFIGGGLDGMEKTIKTEEAVLKINVSVYSLEDLLFLKPDNDGKYEQVYFKGERGRYYHDSLKGPISEVK